MNKSFAFSILKCEYGWGGCTKTGEQMQRLDAICEQFDCPYCAAAAMAAFLYDEIGEKTFRPRLDGLPNKRSVVRDREGGSGCVVH